MPVFSSFTDNLIKLLKVFAEETSPTVFIYICKAEDFRCMSEEKKTRKISDKEKKKRISKKTGTSAMPVPTLVVTSRRKACMHASRLWRNRARSLDFSRLENVSYTTASNCNHWRTTQISTTCCTQQQACVPIREQQNIKHMSYITARNCHHQKTTKRQTHVIHNSTIREQQKCQTHVVHNSKQLSPSEHNKVSYTTVSNCHHHRTTKCQTCHTQQQVTVTSEEQQKCQTHVIQ